MRAAIACNSPWGVGGQGNCLRQAALGLSALGPLTVFCKGGGGAPPPEIALRTIPLDRAGALLRSVPVVRRRKDWAQLVSDLAFDHSVAARIEAEAEVPDLFVGVAMQSLHALRAARRRGARTWLYCLNTWIPFMQEKVAQEYGMLGEWGGAEIHPYGVRRFLQECEEADAVVVLSELSARTFRDAGFTDRPVYVLPPSVDADRFRPDDRDRFRSPDELRVLYVGTISPRKGVHYLLDAIGRLDPDRVRLVLVGGATTRRMRRRIDEALRTLPVDQLYRDFSRDDPTEVFGTASVLVLPSVEDGFGLVALEAMASGLPVITTTHCGAADVVEEGVNGFVVPPRDPAALAERLAWMQAHPSDWEPMRRAARETALRYSQRAYDERITAVLESPAWASA